jgi:hypothetical protein
MSSNHRMTARRGSTLPALALALALMGAVAVPGNASAHHSFAMFDKSRMVTISGTIKSVEWTNPHVWIWVSVPRQGGAAEDWGLESGGPSQMNRMGIKRTMFTPGDKITVELFPMKDGRVGGQFRKATLADGTKIDMGESVKAFADGGQSAPPGQP